MLLWVTILNCGIKSLSFGKKKKKYHQDQRGISASVNNYSWLFATHYYFSKPTQKGIKPYKCDSCDATFARKAHMRRHNESIHQGIRRKPLNCDNCEFVCYHHGKS